MIQNGDSVFDRAALLLVVVGGALGVIASAAADNASLVAGGGFTALALSGFTLMWRSLFKEIKRLREQVEQERKDRVVAEWKFDIVLRVAREGGVSIPGEVWRDPTPQEYDQIERGIR